jgi:hypothetical protein
LFWIGSPVVEVETSPDCRFTGGAMLLGVDTSERMNAVGGVAIGAPVVDEPRALAAAFPSAGNIADRGAESLPGRGGRSVEEPEAGFTPASFATPGRGGSAIPTLEGSPAGTVGGTKLGGGPSVPAGGGKFALG